MNICDTALSKSKRVEYSLKNLYEGYGYSQYKMSKFEEYDLYVRNKSFLLSDHIITFTDIDGKLMALKPDVTLSIVKNSRDVEGGVRKVYYNENVYRVPKGAMSFKEIMQTGLECIGELDTYSICEVLTLAAKSLEAISNNFVLDVSDLSVMSAIIDGMGFEGESREALLQSIGQKNLSEIDRLCKARGVDGEKTERLKNLLSINGSVDEMMGVLYGCDCDAAGQLADIVSVLQGRFEGKIRIDFSVIDDMRYYNGIVFKGFVNGIPTSVLSGGRYDKLMNKMGKSSGAIGFAVYLDTVDGLDDAMPGYDIDVFVLYCDRTDLSEVCRTVESCAQNGRRCLAGKRLPDTLKCRELISLVP